MDMRERIFAVLFLAIGFTRAAAAGELSGQGLPRASEELCKSALTQITAKLANNSYETIDTSCVGTNEDVGSFVPTYKAKSSTKNYTAPQHLIGMRVYVASSSYDQAKAACESDLGDLKKKLGADYTVNARAEDPVEAIKKLGGADAAVSLAVSPRAFEQAFRALRR